MKMRQPDTSSSALQTLKVHCFTMCCFLLDASVHAVCNLYRCTSITVSLWLQVIFTSIPVWSALLAYTVLGEQPLGLVGSSGAALVIASTLSIALSSAASKAQ